MKRNKTYKKKSRSMRATGAVSFGFHEGSHSEVLVDYLFSAWGTVTPARRQSDYGLDLYCTLTERVGPRARVQEYFSVQVKSSAGALWAFNDPASVKWLIDHPLPLFLSTVDKKNGIVRGQNGASAKRTAQVVVDQADRTIKRTVPALAAFPIQMRFFAPNNAHRVPALRPQVPGGGTRPSRRRNWNANERGVALSV
jgi:Domain of unknown function (DUF4365)